MEYLENSRNSRVLSTRAAYRNFRKRHRSEFVALAARCTALSMREIKSGEFSCASGVLFFSSDRYVEKSSKRRHPKTPG
jgi:hypothetical protein